MFRRRMVCFSFLAILPFVWSGCASNSPPQAIIGTWETGTGEKKKTMTFWDNGVWNMETGRNKQTGTYKFLDEKKIEMKVDVPTDAKPIVYTRTISFSHHDKMNMTDVETSRRTTWKRIEQQ